MKDTLKNFQGMMAPVLTPYDSTGEINLSMIKDYAAYLWNRGVKGVYVCGTAGEGMSLTVDERKAIAEEWVRVADLYPFKTLIMIGTGSLKTSQILASHAASLNVDGIASIGALYDKPQTVEDLVDYCKDVASSAPQTPFFYYHIPFKTGINIPMDEFLVKGAELIPTLTGMKFTSEAVSDEGLRCLRLQNGRFTIFSGFDQMLHTSLKLGFKCAINGCFNFIPKRPAEIFDFVLSSSETDWKLIELRQKEINEIMGIISSFTNGFSVASVKAAMKILTGIDTGPARKPVRSLTSAQIAEMAVQLKPFQDK